MITKEYIQENLLRNEYQLEVNKTRHLDITTQELYHIYFEIAEIPKCDCGKNKKFLSFKGGYNETCGRSDCAILKRSTSNSDNKLKEYIKSIEAAGFKLLEKSTCINKEYLFKCKCGNEFKEVLKKVYNGKECETCTFNKRSNIRAYTEKEFIDVLKNKNNNMKLISKYIPGKIYLDFKCKCGNISNMQISNVMRGGTCLKCSKQNSNVELEIIEYIKSLGVNNILHNNRKILNGKELDIFLPDYNIAIEYNGLLWHSRGLTFPSNIDKFNKFKHNDKTNLCINNNIHLLQIFENEWYENKDKWKSVIRNKLKKNKNKIYARKTVFKKITSSEASIFCENNHLQGKGTSSLNYGLFYNTELVSVMTFSKARFIKDANIKYEMIRFCNKINHSIIGGASKLLKNFRLLHTGGIVSYANRRWSDGHLYKMLGFNLKNISVPNYFYFNKERILWSRNKFQKHKLSKLEIFDIKKTETENMFLNGYRQIHDCGNYVFVLN